ncbi:uncharacterized protein F5891DRAFT_304031 [Suillus fuscotomentosus]|uniref:Uncharacterized protein n=1 Tax=Suillus fuscotomentosus TaxID=1912939 RepID=A0AAD4E6W3_9AGAM|nr:uncharacterized protein F5891DRAFT_105220 [Suillus fuscotomentosus]XP_041226258.1 uncharacterized protein F5891DRAFT_304031 [Suillus fuscotomentosus]KAG1891586.1 hypothetical protein F5891DRAFT_105220 [Suillus fuscotomentosus]KAG1900682.1 hypothetical protein F5891DRAFT_304031 [Suillus fuscotomentosus]
MLPTNLVIQSMQGQPCSRPSRRVSRSHSYDQPPNSVNIVSRRQGSSSFPIHDRLPSDASHTSWSSDHPVSSVPTLSPTSTYSTLSWSGSSRTQERLSPITPELFYSPSTTIASPEVTPITAFLSEFYEPDSKSGSGTRTLVHLSRGDPRRLDLFGERDRNGMKNAILTESPVSYLADGANPPLPDDIHLIETPTPIPLSAASCAHGQGSGHEVDVRKSRRFCRDFGEPVPSKDPIYDEFPTHLAKDLPTTPLSSSPPSPLSHDLLPPPSRSEVCNLFSEDETTAVREFLRIWGSNKRVKKSSSKLQVIEDEAPGTQGDDDYSWEAAEVEDDVGDSASCSMLLHEVSEMVGISLETSMVEGQSSIASTPPGLDTLGRLIQDSHESSQILGLRSSYQSAPPDGANVCDRTSTSSCHRMDPLDVAPRHSVTSSLVLGSNPSIREYAVAAKPVDVPVIVALTSNEAYSANSCDGLVPDRQLSLRRSRSTDGNLRRRGQIFNVEKQVMGAVPSGVVDSCTSYIPTRDAPPLPPLPPPSGSVRPVSALDRLESSLSRLKAHNSQSRKSSKANVPSENRRPSPFTTSRERKHHSSVAARLPDSRSGHGRHFSSPMADVTAHRNHRKPPRVETDPINARLKERDAKLYPYSENPESAIRSFMEMDVVPPPPPPPRTSRLGRVAARLSRGITNWGRNIGSKGKESS